MHIYISNFCTSRVILATPPKWMPLADTRCARCLPCAPWPSFRGVVTWRCASADPASL